MIKFLETENGMVVGVESQMKWKASGVGGAGGYTTLGMCLMPLDTFKLLMSKIFIKIHFHLKDGFAEIRRDPERGRV